MDNNQTRGVDMSPDGFISVDSNNKEKTVPIEPSSGDNFGFKHIPTVIKSLEEHLPFTALLTGVIGYILISTFGKMDSVAKYFGYIFFLFFAFFFYKLLKSDIKMSFWNKFFMYGFFVSILFFIIKYYTVIKFYFHSIIKFFT